MLRHLLDPLELEALLGIGIYESVDICSRHLKILICFKLISHLLDGAQLFISFCNLVYLDKDGGLLGTFGLLLLKALPQVCWISLQVLQQSPQALSTYLVPRTYILVIVLPYRYIIVYLELLLNRQLG